MKKQKKRLLLICSAVVVLCGVLISVFVLKTALVWTPLYRVSNCEGLDAPIETIKLRKYASIPVGVVFDDEDLLAVWTKYFEQMEVKREGTFEPKTNMTGGEEYLAVVTTTSGEYRIRFLDMHPEVKFEVNQDGELIRTVEEWDGKYRIEINGYTYDVKSDMECLFEQMYEVAVARHGENSETW